MSKSDKSPGELYLEKAKSSGLMNEKNRAGFEAVAEMLNSPYSFEQMKAQVERAKISREEQRKCKITS